jgi:hypothetical protein
MNAWLMDHARNVHSQAGEDGILAKVLDLLPDRNRWCVEFGAWDGEHFSNTRNLVVQEGYSAVLIEADAGRFAELEDKYRGNPGIVGVQAFVGFEPHDNLDVILARTPIPTTFDLLSIDIDGNDYHVWEAVARYRARVVVIEYNPTIPTEVDFVQARDGRVMHGASIAAIVALGKRKGYELVATTTFNCIFVERADFPRYRIADNSVATLRRDTSLVTHIFSGYDGRIFLEGCRRLPWHDIPYREGRVQQLPGFLRDWPERYGGLRHNLYAAYRRLLKEGMPGVGAAIVRRLARARDHARRKAASA